MDGQRFDALARALGRGLPRRRVLQAVSAAVAWRFAPSRRAFAGGCVDHGECQSGLCCQTLGRCSAGNCCTGLMFGGGPCIEEDGCVDDFCVDPGCTGQPDCAAGQLCCGGQCVALECCPSDGDPNPNCPSGSLCIQGVCGEVGCNANGCSDGTICCHDVCLALECCVTDGVQNNPRCPAGSACVDGYCGVTSCPSSDYCEAGGVCCDGTCRYDIECCSVADCPSTLGPYVCQSGQCISLYCGSDYDCFDGNGNRGAVCCEGVCNLLNECCASASSTAYCQPGDHCVDLGESGNRCVSAPCNADSECSGICCNGACYNGECCSAVLDDTHCPSGTVCFEGQCDPAGCGKDADCPSGYVCTNGVCAAAPAETPAPPAAKYASKWELWTGDHRLNGATAYLRRTTGDDPRSFGTGVVGPDYAKSDFTRLAKLGANLVTLSFPAIFAEEPPYRLDEPLRDQLDGYLRLAKSADLFAIISFRTGPGRTETATNRHLLCQAGGCLTGGPFAAPSDDGPSSLWSDPKAQDAWVTLWQKTAHRYRTNKTVIGYHLMAFPDAPDAEVYLALMQRIVTAIRTVDTETPILIGAPGEGTPLDLADIGAIAEERAVYVVGVSAPKRYVAQANGASKDLVFGGKFNKGLDNETGAFDGAWLQRFLDPALTWSAAQKRPMAIERYGVPRWQPELAAYLTELLRLFDAARLRTSLWQWLPEVAPRGDDAFDLEYGPDPGHHQMIANDLLGVIAAYWKANAVRPSNAPS